LSLANCAALLEKEGHKVKILDAHAQRMCPIQVSRFACNFDKVFVTSSSLDKWQCPNIDINPFIETVQHLRETNNEIYVMTGR